jgi:mannosyltransferase
MITTDTSVGRVVGTGPRSQPLTVDRRWQVCLIGVFAATLALRFMTRSPMWLDEAQTVAIARRSVTGLLAALRHDGSPPLYYIVLHGWMSIFGTGSFAVRSLSGLCAVLALPAMVYAARSVWGRGGPPLAAALLLATCPFAVRYATEARMYSLVILLVLLAVVLYERVWRRGGWVAGIGAAIVTAALLLTHYWSLFALAVLGGAALAKAIRGSRPARRLLLSMTVGALAFVPWIPSFLFQSRHTGAPWGSPASLAVPFRAPSDWAGAGTVALLLAACYYGLSLASIAGRQASPRGIVFRRPLRPVPTALLAFAFATMLFGTVASQLSHSAYATRYSAIALAPALLAFAGGLDALPSNRRPIALALISGAGLIASSYIPFQLRTQAGQVASVLKSALPGDVVVFCPDQLGPAVHRLAPRAGRQVVYPTMAAPGMVDWVDYATRNGASDPEAFAQRSSALAGRDATVWLVYANGYPTLGDDCTAVYAALSRLRGPAVTALTGGSDATERDQVAEFLPAAP